MRSFFERSNVYTSSLNRQEIEMTIRSLLSTESHFLFFKQKEYKGKLKKNKFKFYKKFSSNQFSNPEIKGKFISENPLMVEIRITPHYFKLLFFLIFPIIFIPESIFADEMTINGVLREPTLVERLAFGSFGGLVPIIWGYIDTFSKYNKTEVWINNLFKLNKIDSKFYLKKRRRVS
ncbi:hypothetical protein EI427_21005 [Flammeovirga pectinis]|uniref:Uncharacterized protein n=1 Tax=Flammeovirga pectinis TaxID=2494373 RepID=A0A3Q9FUH3_9BACT|nr:hypothetical protein [Flammeovirga pectinis]AZQ64705.1 hypothetical protein EI427_21005 [Flammeovirga pectinis]